MSITRNKHLLAAIMTAIVLRAVFVFVFTDASKDYYWEYGELSRNMVSGNGYSLFYFDQDTLRHHYAPEKKAYPSAYMPPGYTILLTPFITIDDVHIRNLCLYMVNILLSAVLVVLVYRLTERCFSSREAAIASFIVAVLPDFIYSVSSFTPTIPYQIGMAALMILLLQPGTIPWTRLARIAFLSGGLVYLRFEFAAFSVMLGLDWVWQRRYISAAWYLCAMVVFLSPWVLRNYAVFDEFIPFTTSAGLNLYRGNNEGNIGDWGSERTNRILQTLPRTDRFEVSMDSLFKKESMQYISAHPERFIENGVKKITALWIADFYSEQPFRPLLIVYSVLLFGLFLIGAIQSFDLVRYRSLYLSFLTTTAVSALFFVLPRYKTTFMVLLIPFIAAGIEQLRIRAVPRRSVDR